MDIAKSGTRKEERLIEQGDLSKMWVLRRILNPMGTVDAMEFLLEKMKATKNNADFFDSMNQQRRLLSGGAKELELSTQLFSGSQDPCGLWPRP